jgi:hypothetical protein
MIRTGEECEVAIAVADPDLGCPGIEIEDAFFGDLGCGVGGGEDLDANLRGAGEKGNVLADLIAAGIKPTDISGSTRRQRSGMGMARSSSAMLTGSTSRCTRWRAPGHRQGSCISASGSDNGLAAIHHDVGTRDKSSIVGGYVR